MIVRQNENRSILRVLDFGLAKLYESTEVPLTHTGAILGTPSYLSPEGARGQPATPRSDVYSLATVAFECFAGHPPFQDSSPIKVLMQQVDSELPPLVRPAGSGDVPPAVAKTIIANLSKSPGDRTDSALGFARSLRQAAALHNLSMEDFGPGSHLWRNSSDVEQWFVTADCCDKAPMDESGLS